MKTLEQLYEEYDKLIDEGDPFNREGTLRHMVIRKIRWNRFVESEFVKLLQKSGGAMLMIDEEKGYIKFVTKKFGRMTYFPQKDRLNVHAQNKWYSGGQNWLKKNLTDIVPKQEHIDFDTEYQIYLMT